MDIQGLYFRYCTRTSNLGEKYPTQSFSLFIYLTLNHFAGFKAHESIQACSLVVGGLAAACNKLLKFFYFACKVTSDPQFVGIFFSHPSKIVPSFNTSLKVA